MNDWIDYKKLYLELKKKTSRLADAFCDQHYDQCDEKRYGDCEDCEALFALRPELRPDSD